MKPGTHNLKKSQKKKTKRKNHDTPKVAIPKTVP